MAPQLVTTGSRRGVPSSQTSQTVLIVMVAGFGGTLPTLSRLAAQYVNAPGSPLPPPGMLLGLVLFFIIGCVLALAFGEKSLRQALIIGISAPAIITSISVGAGDGKKATETINSTQHRQELNDTQTLKPGQSGFLFENFIGHAFAEEYVRPIPYKQNQRSFVSLDRTELFGSRNLELQFQTKGNGDLVRLASVQLRFFDEGGYRIDTATTDINLASTELYRVHVPNAARGFVLQAGDLKVSKSFPAGGFQKIAYSVQTVVSEASGFAWALGYERNPASVTKININQIELVKGASTGKAMSKLSSQYVFGVVASHFQQSMDWDSVYRDGIKFALLRASYGIKKDENFDEFLDSYLDSMHRDDIAVGYYHFFRFRQDVDKQVETFVAAIKSKQTPNELPNLVAISRNQFDPTVSSDEDRAEFVAEVRDFIKKVESKTHEKLMIGLGVDAPALVSIKEVTGSRPVMIRDFFDSEAPAPEGVDVRIWQFGVGEIDGIPTPVDLAVFNGEPARFNRFVQQGR